MGRKKREEERKKILEIGFNLIIQKENRSDGISAILNTEIISGNRGTGTSFAQRKVFLEEIKFVRFCKGTKGFPTAQPVTF